MNLYTIKEIKNKILRLDDTHKFVGSIPIGENLYLIYSTNVPTIEKIATIKVCWVNNMKAIYKEDNIHIISYVNEMEATQIDEQHHIFEILQLEEDMTETDFSYIGRKIAEKMKNGS